MKNKRSNKFRIKILDRYSLTSLLKIASVTLVLCTFMMLLVELFANFSTYTEPYMNFQRAVVLLALRIPYAISFTIGPAFLFATTFFISSLYSNNELISILSAGIPYRRLIKPICIMAFVISVLMFAFNELVYVPSIVKYKTTLDSYKNYDASYEGDNTNIFYSDSDNNFIVKADKYTDIKEELTGVELIYKNQDGSVGQCITARQAVWNNTDKQWNLKKVKIYSVNNDEFSVLTDEKDEYVVSQFTTEPSFFKNIRSDIQTMSIPSAVSYIRAIKTLSMIRYSELATDFYERILSCFTVFVMIIVSVSVNIKYKKNVLLFSIISSVSLGVIYYVVQLVTLLIAKQGMIAPIFGMLIPFMVIILIALISSSRIKS
ncbi:MAG: LptF/LptG family permease [Sphaerochaetaceae bacterium]|nr:LptF/LptG family permease [Spirochaetales bacterium]MDY3768826.1 LptF/LptG family permease [Sphaerochaetaceae bacterium]MDY5967781.1 LptF/LptG family permease [Sphaerochaetaceae bacterium]